jgi:hypothetical protein
MSSTSSDEECGNWKKTWGGRHCRRRQGRNGMDTSWEEMKTYRSGNRRTRTQTINSGSVWLVCFDIEKSKKWRKKSGESKVNDTSHSFVYAFKHRLYDSAEWDLPVREINARVQVYIYLTCINLFHPAGWRCRLSSWMKQAVVASFWGKTLHDFFICVGVMYSSEYDVCHRGQANFSACPVWMHTQSNITNKTLHICSIYSIWYRALISISRTKTHSYHRILHRSSSPLVFAQAHSSWFVTQQVP